MLSNKLSARFFFKVRDELEQLLDDDDDMADLYLSRKTAKSASVSSDFGHDDESPTLDSKMSGSSNRGSAVISTQGEDSVEELEMLLEVLHSTHYFNKSSCVYF